MESSIRSPQLHISCASQTTNSLSRFSPKNRQPAECSTNRTASVTPPNPKNITTRMHNLGPARVNVPRQAANQMTPLTDNQLKSAASAQNNALDKRISRGRWKIYFRSAREAAGSKSHHADGTAACLYFDAWDKSSELFPRVAALTTDSNQWHWRVASKKTAHAPCCAVFYQIDPLSGPDSSVRTCPPRAAPCPFPSRTDKIKDR
jgi:hypothetical protein